MRALLNTLHGSTGVIGKEQFRASSGVRQGGASSCPVFTFFIDPTIEAISSTGPDGWLEGIHCLLLMDDTVVFATSREKLAEKLGKLKQCTDDIGMTISIHPSKSQFLCVNSTDTRPVLLDKVTIAATKSYMYLGTTILNAPIKKQVQHHIDTKSSHLHKFTSFLKKNK